MRTLTPLLISLAACGKGQDIDTDPTGDCDLADRCITVADDGTINLPSLSIQAGESVAFVLGNRWQSVAAIDPTAEQACSTAAELPYIAGEGLTGPMPHFAGGITVRGEPNGSFRFPKEVWESEAISGVLLVVPWRDVEPSQGAYDFSVFTDALTDATRTGKLVSVGIQAGAKCPSWLYDFSTTASVPGNTMVTKATNGERCFDQIHPSFWDETYVARLTALQTALADELLAHGGSYRHVDKIKISGVNLLTSETRMPVNREDFCGFSDAVCSNGNQAPTPCDAGVCPTSGCGCFEDPADGLQKCGRTTDDLPQVWADAGFRPNKLATYFRDLYDEQAALFPTKDLNLMEIARAFPNVNQNGVVQGFADPNHVRALIAQEVDALPDRFVVLNAALKATAAPQDICLEAYDIGAQQIGFQTVNGLNTWEDLEPALANARDVTTPNGDTAVSFVEIYLSSLISTLTSGNEADLATYDQTFRARSGLASNEGEVHLVENLPPGEYAYKITGTGSNTCQKGVLTVLP